MTAHHPHSETHEERRRRHWIELAVVASFAVVIDTVHALSPYPIPEDRWPLFDSLGILARSLAVLAPILYIMWRSGEPWRAFGFRRWRWGVDLPLTAGLIIAGLLAYWVYAELTARGVLSFSRGPGWWETPSDAGVKLVRIGAEAANGLAEEVAIWGFLSTRLRDLSNRPAFTVIACSAMFAAYHIYQGLWAAGAVFVFGLVHGAVFMHTRRIWPLAAAHAANNIWILLRTG